ncbi:MAG: MerR family transcriptional regulator [Actinobacteria bacterium]|jgi:DNA-binding transcriptional MerR regulator|nr:MerR family transcriptional regulator [Actinomycetota bacterium]
MEDTPSHSTQAGRGGSETAAESLLTIGQVVARLQSEFPDLSISKIRYLEDRKLLSPARTKGRYRKYSSADIRRLRTILTLQRDEYLPLEVIRQRVERASSPVPGQSLTSAVTPLRSTQVLRREESVYSWDDICRQLGMTDSFLRMLTEYRLVEPAAQTGLVFTESDLEIARICQLLERFGVEPRHLRLMVSTTEREAAILEQVATPRLLSTHHDKREYGEQLLSDLGALFSQLTHLLLYKELRKAL